MVSCVGPPTQPEKGRATRPHAYHTRDTRHGALPPPPAQEFKEQHLVLNGASDVMMQVFEDRGYHARSAIGTNTLPLDIAVEVEAIVKVRA